MSNDDSTDLRCANFDVNVSPSFEIPRMEFVFELS